MTLLEVAKENQDLLNDGILTLLLYKRVEVGNIKNSIVVNLQRALAMNGILTILKKYKS